MHLQAACKKPFKASLVHVVGTPPVHSVLLYQHQHLTSWLPAAHLLRHAFTLDVHNLPSDQALCANSLADLTHHLQDRYA